MRFFMSLVFMLASLSTAFCDEAPRPGAWAEPVFMKGVPNLHKVDEGVYRSAQPSALGMRNLDAAGFRTVINLRSFHTDKGEAKGTGLHLEQITMKAWHPEVKEVERFFSIVMEPANRPVLFHCWHGADRTGTLSSLYRVVVQGWAKESAIDEMVNGGYGFHAIWPNLPHWIRDFDVEAMAQKVKGAR